MTDSGTFEEGEWGEGSGQEDTELEGAALECGFELGDVGFGGGAFIGFADPGEGVFLEGELVGEGAGGRIPEGAGVLGVELEELEGECEQKKDDGEWARGERALVMGFGDRTTEECEGCGDEAEGEAEDGAFAEESLADVDCEGECGGGDGKEGDGVEHECDSYGARGMDIGALDQIMRARKIHWKAKRRGATSMRACWKRMAALKRGWDSPRRQSSSRGTGVARVFSMRRPAWRRRFWAVSRV